MAALEVFDAPALESMPTERLEAEACTLAAQIAAATYRFVMLIAELDRREVWRQWGCRSTAHWLAWKCALSPGAAREHVRVARALDDLPGTADAFAAGRLSYSKVRALTRVAARECETELLEFAEVATAAQLEFTVRGYERTRGDAAAESARLAARGARFFTESDGTVTLQARLTPEQAEVVRHALEKAMKEVPLDGEDVSAETRRADALELVGRVFLAGRNDRPTTELVVHVDEEQLSTGDVSPVVERVLCDCAVRVVTDAGATKRTRTIPITLRRLIERRDERRCRFPGCANTRYLHVHHTAYFTHGGPTDAANCFLLCTFHHRLVHEGGWVARGNAGTELRFVNRRGREIPEREEPIARLPKLHDAAAIDDKTIATSTGERLDRVLAVHVFHEITRRNRR